MDEKTPEQLAAEKKERQRAQMAKARAARLSKAPITSTYQTEGSNGEVKLSAERLAEIKAEAAEVVREERLKQLEAQALKEALEELRGKEGLRTGRPHEDELVEITIDMGASSDGPLINGVKYHQGRPYTVPRHFARSLLEMMYRTHMHEQSISGKTLSEWVRKPHSTVISPTKGVANAPTQIEVGQFFVKEPARG